LAARLMRFHLALAAQNDVVDTAAFSTSTFLPTKLILEFGRSDLTSLFSSRSRLSASPLDQLLRCRGRRRRSSCRTTSAFRTAGALSRYRRKRAAGLRPARQVWPRLERSSSPSLITSDIDHGRRRPTYGPLSTTGCPESRTISCSRTPRRSSPLLDFASTGTFRPSRVTT